MRRTGVFSWATLLAVFAYAEIGCDNKKADEPKRTDDTANTAKKAKVVGDDPVPSEPPKLSLDKPDFVVDSTAFDQEWKKDDKAALKKYAGKVIEVSGKVNFVSHDRTEGIIFLKGERPAGVECHAAEMRPWNKAAPGQTAVIRGVLHPQASEPYLTDCVVVKADGPKPPEVSVDEFQAEHIKDLDSTRKKYQQGEHVVLVSELQRIDDKTVLVFKSKEPAPIIEAAVPRIKEFVVEGLRAGTKLKILGNYLSIDVTKDRVRIDGCVLVEGGK